MIKKISNIGDCGIVCDFGDEVNREINLSCFSSSIPTTPLILFKADFTAILAVFSINFLSLYT